MKFTTISQAKKWTGLAYLGGINTSSKIMKNQTVSHNYTYLLYLAPANTSGYNVCSHSTPECRLGCLATSGRAAIELRLEHRTIEKARIKKSRLFNENQEFFMDWLVAEIAQYRRKAVKDGYDFSVRLNGTSDIDWVNIKLNGLNIFEIYNDVQFYDYTKNGGKFLSKPGNYHLTLSYTGRNNEAVIATLKAGHNVAVIFNVKKESELPTMFDGFEVVNGDLTDYRVNDGNGKVIGLKWKNIANREVNQQIKESLFVIQPNDKRNKR